MDSSVALIGMLFMHIVDDFYLQGILASMKQKGWWEKNAPESMYKYDYIMALLMHALSWAIMIQLIPIISTGNVKIALFIINVAIHMFVDNLKANKKKINLIVDQSIHLVQIIVTWLVYFIL